MNISRLHTLEKLLSSGVDIPRDDESSIYEPYPIAGILIPRIQRPYAQGRSDKSIQDIRRDFIERLFSVLSSQSETKIELSFVFGSLQKVKWNESNGGDMALELLDGQQRLTTLFLLHWYLYKKENQDNIPEWLSHFKYETRDSSTAFLLKITAKDSAIDLNEIIKRDDSQEVFAITPSEAITRLKWYNNDFRCDTTVISMLRMLDEIDSQYKVLEKEGRTFAHSLHRNLGRIRFYVRLLLGFDMPDMLFIKMNSRGLALIPFENFKADVLKYMEHTKDYGEKVIDKSGEYPEFQFYFASQIDTKWVYLFWDGVEFPSDGSIVELKDKQTGARFFRFFNRMLFAKLAIDYAETDSEESKVKDKLAKACNFFRTVPEVDMEEHLTDWNNQYLPAIERWQGEVDYFRQSAKILNILFDNYTSGFDLRNSIRRPPFMVTSNFELYSKSRGANGEFTYAHRAFMTILLDFLMLMPSEEAIDSPEVANNLKRLIRVLHNVLEHTEIDKENILDIIKAFHNILKQTDAIIGNFYKALSTYDGERIWIKAESEKAQDICEDENFEAVMIRAEEHPILRGRLTPLYESGKMSVEELAGRVEEFYRIFPVDETGICRGISEEYAQADSHLLIRALLSYFNDWENLNGTYITERGFIVQNGTYSNSRYLSDILFGKGNAEQLFQKYFADYFGNTEFEKLLVDRLAEVDVNKVKNNGTQSVYVRLVIDPKSPKIFQWIKSREAERMDKEPVIRWLRDAGLLNYDGTKSDRLVLTTPRRVVIPEVLSLTSAVFEDDHQNGHVERFGEYFAYDICIVKIVHCSSGKDIAVKAIFYPSGWCKVYVKSGNPDVHNAIRADREKDTSCKWHWYKDEDKENESAQEISNTINEWAEILQSLA